MSTVKFYFWQMDTAVEITGVDVSDAKFQEWAQMLHEGKVWLGYSRADQRTTAIDLSKVFMIELRDG